MKRIANAVGLLAVLTGTVAANETESAYPNYYQALKAQARGDCDATVGHLEAFLEANAYVKDLYPDFYAEVKYVMGQCTGTVIVRGVEEDALAMDPLPEETPMEE